MRWCAAGIENLLSNAVDSLEGKNGTVTVTNGAW